jgi:hypothetical protein
MEPAKARHCPVQPALRRDARRRPPLSEKLQAEIRGLAALQDLRVLVVGEAIVDEYNCCTPLGKSPKEAIVSTRHLRSEVHAGAVLACANDLAGFCAEVHVVTCLGAGRRATRERVVGITREPDDLITADVRDDAASIEAIERGGDVASLARALLFRLTSLCPEMNPLSLCPRPPHK